MNQKILSPHIIQKYLSKVSPISSQTSESLSKMTKLVRLRKNEYLVQEKALVRDEFFVINGITRTYLTDSEGEEATINFHTTEQAITPSLLRANNYISFVNIQVISEEAELLYFSIKGMEEKMQNLKDLQRFGHTLVMGDSLMRAERELMLAKCRGKEKLEWFRSYFDDLENKIPHYYIASYLGLTTTSLSRLRSQS